LETQTSAQVPAVSVVLSAFNPGGLVLDAIRSALAQTLTDLEVVYVDGASTDGTAAALAAIGDPRLRVFRQEKNEGVAGGYNEAIRRARAPWIAIMDGDDLMHPRRLELQLAALAADPSLDFVSCDLEMIDAAGIPLGRAEFLHTPDEIARYAAYNMPVAHPGLTGRREVLRRYPYRPEFASAPDFDLLARLTEGHRVAALPIPLYRWRRHPGSSTFSMPDRVEAYTCMGRIATARRRQGRDEQLGALAALTATLVQERVPLHRVFARYAAVCAAENLHVLACLHAALAQRHGGGPGAALRYGWSLLRALAAEPAGLPAALGSVGKAPFWMLLKRAGFPAFPRY
jgi:hypothetical protein